MRFSLTSLVRLTVFFVIAANAVAIGLARLEPPQVRWLYYSTAPTVFDGGLFSFVEKSPRMVDPATGYALTTKLSAGEEFDRVSCSPWESPDGERLAAARWVRHTGERGEIQCDALGIARYEVKSGRVVDRLSLDKVPDSPPCWDAHDPSRILYASCDGRLYTLRFGESGRESETEPTPLVWECEHPGGDVEGREFIADPVWLGLKGLERIVFASVRVIEHTGVSLRFGPMRLWWMRIGNDGLSVVETGCLTPDGEPSQLGYTGQPVERRDFSKANVARRKTGEPVIAYLSEARGCHSFRLRLSRLEVDARTGTPLRCEPYFQRIDGNIAGAMPGLSPDGEWVTVVKDAMRPTARIERLRVSAPPDSLRADNETAVGKGGLRSEVRAAISPRG